MSVVLAILELSVGDIMTM